MSVVQAPPVKLVGPEVIAEQLSVDANTIRRWACQGRIPSVRVTKKVVRFDPAKVLESLERSQA